MHGIFLVVFLGWNTWKVGHFWIVKNIVFHTLSLKFWYAQEMFQKWSCISMQAPSRAEKKMVKQDIPFFDAVLGAACRNWMKNLIRCLKYLVLLKCFSYFGIFRTIASFIKISLGHSLIIRQIFIKFFRTILEIGVQMSWVQCLTESLLLYIYILQ